MKTLIMVESPHKTEAIARYAREVLPGTVTVRACLGHLRDLPPGRLGVDVANGFRPEYQVLMNRQKTVEHLRPAIRAADRVLMATDPDREGEAVAWHVTKVFETELQGKTVARISFNAITRKAVQAALAKPYPLNKRLVRAAVARRVLDRLVGYTLSPRLWAAVQGKDLSAGRVQTVALRLLVDQEQARRKSSRERWSVEVEI
jgi:DNA topoisomerase-1